MKLHIFVSICLLGAMGSIVEGRSMEKEEEIDPADLIVIDGNTFYISPANILEDAYKATAYCDADGMKLVSFATEEKWMAVQDYLISNTTYGNNRFWSSLSKFGDSWKWGNGNFASFFAWAENEPNENRDGVCVNFVATEGWADEPCRNSNAAFICELVSTEF